MFRTVGCAAIILAAVAAPAAAQSWGFSVGTGFGAPVYYGPPPVYYDAPIYAPPPRVIYRRAPRMVSPEVVFDLLDANGYREFSPMARRGEYYRLHAVDPSGNLVALEVSIFTGEIERARILEARVSPSPPKVAPKPRKKVAAKKPRRPKPAAPAAAAPPPPPPAAAGEEPSTLLDRLDAPPEEAAAADGEDPLVVY